MPLVGFGIAFLGYSLLYYGLTQVRGENYGLLDLVIPGRFAQAKDNPKDGAAAQASTSADTGSTTAPAPTAAPATAPAATAAPATRPAPSSTARWV